MQPSPGRWPCLSLYLTTPQLAKNGFEIEFCTTCTFDFWATYSKAPIIRAGHWRVLAVHSMYCVCTADLAYVPVRIIETLE
jgi:hypothetical protein